MELVFRLVGDIFLSVCSLLLLCNMSKAQTPIRTCRNRLVPLLHPDFMIHDITYKYRVVVNKEEENIQLIVDVGWEVTLPEDLEWFDGFLVHMLDTEQKNESPPGNSTFPLTSCFSSDSIWVNSTAEDNLEQASAECVNSAGFNTEELFLCPISNCTLFQMNPLLCRGPPYFMGSYRGFYFSIPSFPRMLSFEVEFLKHYQINLLAYVREYPSVDFSQVISPPECPELVIQTVNSTSLYEAHVLCCRAGIDHLVPFNIANDGPTIPDFTSGRINKTISWFSPGTIRKFDGFKILVSALSEAVSIPENTEPVLLSVSGNRSVDGSANCASLSTSRYSTTVYNLEPNISYVIRITSTYNDTALQKLCDEGKCTSRFEFDVEEIDGCSSEYGYCHPNSNCTRNGTSGSIFTPVCTCFDGFEGNGLNTTGFLGSGCVDIDDCSASETPCAENAICIDRIAPDVGVNCTCSSGHYGDGLQAGSGCTSVALTALAIALPLAISAVIAIAFAIWCVRMRRERKRNILFSQFVADDGKGIMHLYENVSAKENAFEPTFGQKWEINRDTLKIDKVLGRGNYGIVCLGYLATEQLDENGEYERIIQNTSNAESSSNGNSETFLMGRENYKAVAVKRLQDGSRNRENLAEFLAEIGFMLSIGNHENILHVYGCCTTEEPVYLVTEYCKYGDLLHFLWDVREGATDPVYKVTEHSLCQMVTDVAVGMEYLERIRIIHGDIAARNILVASGPVCKISDFGLANDVYRYGSIKGHKERFVPFKWISPERMMAGAVPITTKSDVWSFGNLLYEMFTLGCTPYPGIRADELLDKLKSGYRMEQPRTCNKYVYSIMLKCWHWRASSRPNFRQLNGLLKSAMGQRQNDLDGHEFVNAVDELDKEQYFVEVNQQKENGFSNGNIDFVNNDESNPTDHVRS